MGEGKNIIKIYLYVRIVVNITKMFKKKKMVWKYVFISPTPDHMVTIILSF